MNATGSAVFVGVVLLLANSAAHANTWRFDEEAEQRTKAVIRTALLDAPERDARLVLVCERRPWNRWGTLSLSVEFNKPFRMEALIQVLNRLEGEDASSVQMLQSGNILFLSDQDDAVRLGRAFASHSRWTVHANDRSAAFDLPSDGKPIEEFMAWCQKENN